MKTLPILFLAGVAVFFGSPSFAQTDVASLGAPDIVTDARSGDATRLWKDCSPATPVRDSAGRPIPQASIDPDHPSFHREEGTNWPTADDVQAPQRPQMGVVPKDPKHHREDGTTIGTADDVNFPSKPQMGTVPKDPEHHREPGTEFGTADDVTVGEIPVWGDARPGEYRPAAKRATRTTSSRNTPSSNKPGYIRRPVE